MKQEKLMTKKIRFKNMIMKQENSEIGKQVLTDGLDYCTFRTRNHFQKKR